MHYATAGLQQAGDAQRQFVDSGFFVTVFIRQYLALLGKLYFAVYRSLWLRQNGVVGGAAAAPQCAAAAMEQPAFNAMCAGNGNDRSFRTGRYDKRL